MFNADNATVASFVNDPAITAEGSEYLFRGPEPAVALGDPAHDYLIA
jgi:serralysin